MPHNYIMKLLQECVLFRNIGQVLSRENIENIIKFAKREKLFILADEVRYKRSKVFRSRYGHNIQGADSLSLSLSLCV